MNRYSFGVDLGGTAIKIGLFTDEGQCVIKSQIPTRKDNDGMFILDDISEYIEEVIRNNNLNKSDIDGIGIGVPGPVLNESVVLNCINIGWGTFDVAKALSERCGILVKAGNDANVAALGELWYRQSSNYKNAVIITLGTGVGGGIILNGKILEGSNGAAGEIGHLPLVYDETEKCNCGNTGCLEQIASATGLVRLAKKRLAEKKIYTSLEKYDKLTAKDIFDEAKNGDELAVTVVDESLDYLAKAMASIAAIVNPQVFVIGGGMSNAGEFLIDIVKEHYKKYAFGPAKDTKILLAGLGEDAGMYGAAKLVL